jgi:hypothetical protein
MATVKAYSVCKSGGSASTVYSYSPSVYLQDGSVLEFSAATPEDAMRTGLSQAYAHGGVACAAAGGTSEYSQTGGLTPTLINMPSAQKGAFQTGTAPTLTAGDGNPALKSVKVIASTTNISASDVGAGAIVSFTTNADGKPNGTITVLVGGGGYAVNDEVAIDGFPKSKLVIKAVSS